MNERTHTAPCDSSTWCCACPGAIRNHLSWTCPAPQHAQSHVTRIPHVGTHSASNTRTRVHPALTVHIRARAPVHQAASAPINNHFQDRIFHARIPLRKYQPTSSPTPPHPCTVFIRRPCKPALLPHRSSGLLSPLLTLLRSSLPRNLQLLFSVASDRLAVVLPVKERRKG